MPPFATAQTLCASQDGPRTSNFVWKMPTNSNLRCFCVVYLYDYAGNDDLSKGYWNPERKLGVTMHFSEIILSFNFEKIAIHCCMF